MNTISHMHVEIWKNQQIGVQKLVMCLSPHQKYTLFMSSSPEKMET